MADKLIRIDKDQQPSQNLPAVLRDALTPAQIEVLEMYVASVFTAGYRQGVRESSPEARELALQIVAARGIQTDEHTGAVVGMTPADLQFSLSQGTMNAEGGRIQQCICDNNRINPFCTMHGGARHA